MKTIRDIEELLNKFSGFLFDAFGVLMDGDGLLPGVLALLEQIQLQNKPFMILSNGSSKTLEQTVERYHSLGLNVDSSQVITSGTLLKGYLEEHTQPNDPVAFLGTTGSSQLIENSGRVPRLVTSSNVEAEILVIANQTEFPFLESLDGALTMISDRIDAGKPITVVVTNPDLIYPSGSGGFGITAGSLATALREGLKVRYGQGIASIFVELGKPSTKMFDHAINVLNTKDLIMFGDQIYTDVLGAKRAGLASVLMGTGITSTRHLESFPVSDLPNYFLPSLKGNI